MKQKELLNQKLKEQGFKPLPIKSIGKKFKDEAEKQKEIVANCLSEVINSECYIVARDIEWVLYFSEAGFESFGKEKYDLKEVGFSRTRRYIDEYKMRNEFGIGSMPYNEAVRKAFQVNNDVDLRTGKSDRAKVFYKTIDALVDGLKRDLKIYRVDIISK